MVVGGFGGFAGFGGGMLMMLMMMLLNVFGFDFVLFVCLFVCEIRNCRTFTKNCSLFLSFAWTFFVSFHFLHSESAD